jgi:predicted enzyme related to lactoylglutathione lyase
VVDHHGRFVWYELLTTDIAAARAFYCSVVGWGAQEASTPEFAYMLFTAGLDPVSGLMDLPQEARNMGATPRWVGYVAVDDVGGCAEQIKRLGGAIYLPPTDTNIGRIAVVADPQTATLALVDGLRHGQTESGDMGEAGRVGWHELFAADASKAFAFYGEVFDWRETDANTDPLPSYRAFSAGGRTIGGIFTKHVRAPVPFWLYYFNVGDIDTALRRVEEAGGRIALGPHALPGDSGVARCIDPQGAMFALQGPRTKDPTRRLPAPDIGWSSDWGDISSRGRLVIKPRS